MNRRAAVLGVVVLGSLLLGVALRAATTTVQDPNDTTGRLDVDVVKVIREPGRAPKWFVKTYGEWTLPETWDRGYVSVELDTKWGPEADYYALVRSLGNRLEARLFRVRPDAADDVVVARLDVERSNRRSVAVWVPLRKVVFGPSRTTFDWWVLTTYTAELCPATCFDRVPNTGVQTLPVPGAGPSPTSSSPPPTSFAPRP